MKKNPEIEEKNERKITIHNKDNINPDETERQKKLRLEIYLLEVTHLFLYNQ